MRTLVISDLHLGAANGADVLRNPRLRVPLWQALEDVERLVLLGDVLELRHGPRRDALAAARPFFQELGEVLGSREVILLAGNHDHALIDGWLQGRGEFDKPLPLGPEQRFSAGEASTMAAAIERLLAPAKMTVAYPGIWLREDVYATHGHYLDCHITVPTMERLGIGAMSRVLHLPERSLKRVQDYEDLTGPIYAWIDAVAARAATGDALNGQGTVRAWRSLRGEYGGQKLSAQVRGRLLRGAFPVAIAALNRAGIGRFHADISGSQLRSAGLEAMGEVASRLDLGSAHVIFGHTHHTGPLPGRSEPLWLSASGARLMNAGCWTYDAYFLTAVPGESPYWPGGCVLVSDSGPPQLRRLLCEHSHAELRPEGDHRAPAR